MINKKSFLISTLLLISFSIVAQLDFKNPSFIPDQDYPNNSLVADFDGNGLGDIAYVTEPFGIVYVLYNQGGNVFSEQKFQIGTGLSFYFQLESGDFNNDKKADIVFIDTGSSGNDKVVILLSNGNGFTPKRLNLPNSFYVWGVQVVDFDNDGKQDALFATTDGSALFSKGDGNGNFSISSITGISPIGPKFKIHDLNKDGLIDFVFVSQDKLEIYIKDSSLNGYTKATKSFTGFFAIEVTVGDFSGDGYPDIVISLLSNGSDGKVIEYKNLGDGTFGVSLDIQTPSKPFYGLIPTDFNKDGRLDLVVGSFSGSDAVMILQNAGNDTFINKPTGNPLSRTIKDLEVSDLDNDGNLEIIELSVNKILNVYSWSNSSSEFKPIIRKTLGIQALNGVAKDLNADGNIDIIVASPTNACLGVFFGKGDFIFEKPIYINELADVYAVGSADFNGDGLFDIVYATNNFGGLFNRTVILLTAANGGFASPVIVDQFPNYALTTGDFNNDGKQDFAGSSGVYINAGNSVFTKTAFNSPIFVYSIANGDLNGDGFPDLVLNDGNSNYLGINDAKGRFNSFSKIVSSASYSPKVVDVDSDNQLDIVTLSSSSSFIILKNKGNGQFNEQIVKTDGGLSGFAEVADLDNNKTNEIITGLSSQASGNSLLGVAIFSKQSDGSYTMSDKISLARSEFSSSVPDFIQVADLNNDKKNDIIAFRLNAEPIVVLPNDLVVEPSISAKLTVLNRNEKTVSISLTKGDGNGRLAIIRETSSTKTLPSDNMFYTTNAKWGIGAQLGMANYVVAQGDVVSLNITELKEDTNYTIDCYEYSINSKNTIVNYLLNNFGTISFSTKKSQVINFPTISPKIIGAQPFNLTANASSKLPVFYQLISGGVSLLNETVSITSPGPVKIKAIQSGNDEYAPALEIENVFCVIPKQPNISLTNPQTDLYILTSSSDTNNNWLLNGNLIVGAINKTYSPKENGAYSVKVDFDGCSNTSDITTFVVTGLEDLESQMTLYPNPTTNTLTVNLGSLNLLTNDVFIYDQLGKTLTVPLEILNESIIMDVSELKNGFYSVRILSGKSLHNLKFFKQ